MVKHGARFANGKDQAHSCQAHLNSVHPQIAWGKLRSLRDGAAIASKKLWR